MGITHDMREQVSTWVALEAGSRPRDGLDIGFWVELCRVTGQLDMEYFQISVLLAERTYRTVHGGCLMARREITPDWPLREEQIRQEVSQAVQELRLRRDEDQALLAGRRWRALERRLG